MPGQLAATAQCIAASQQAEHGLGQLQTDLSAKDLDIYQKVSHKSRDLHQHSYDGT